MAQVIRCLPPTTGVLSSHIGHSLWVLWWAKWKLGRFFSGFSSFPLSQISFHHFLTHFTLISLISFYSPLWWCIRSGWPAFMDLQRRAFITSQPCVGQELIFLFYKKCAYSRDQFHCLIHYLTLNFIKGPGLPLGILLPFPLKN